MNLFDFFCDARRGYNYTSFNGKIKEINATLNEVPYL